MKGDRIWKAAALVLAVLAVAASLNTWLSAGRYREILAAKEAALQKVVSYAGRWAREDAFRAALEAEKAWQPPDLEKLAIRALGEHAARITPRPATAAANGWQRREVTVELSSVSYEEAALFLASAAEATPAWRLREVDIQPAAEAGQGAMTLVLESLEKKQP